MSDNKELERKARELEALYKQMVDSYKIEDIYPHFYAELQVEKKFRETNFPSALSAEKIAALEKAVEEFRLVYEAEKAEAEKMPLSWHEARRVMRLFEEARDSFGPLPDSPVEH